jgi:hypothetical protein
VHTAISSSVAGADGAISGTKVGVACASTGLMLGAEVRISKEFPSLKAVTDASNPKFETESSDLKTTSI